MVPRLSGQQFFYKGIEHTASHGHNQGLTIWWWGRHQTISGIAGLLLLLLSLFSHVRLCVTSETAAHQAPRPWDSLGKNTGVGCQFLLQCMKVKSESEVAQSGQTLSNPMDCSPPGSSVHGILQARVLDWGAIAFSDLRTDKDKDKSVKLIHFFQDPPFDYSFVLTVLLSLPFFLYSLPRHKLSQSDLS